MADLEALADRVEKLAGPDREVDYLIMAATVLVGHAYLWDPNDQSHRYTASLDAAVTLVPDGLYWHVGSGDDLGPPWAWVGNDHNVRGLPAATPALALTAAALRARSTRQPIGGE